LSDPLIGQPFDGRGEQMATGIGELC
jgi:hypothetical protein